MLTHIRVIKHCFVVSSEIIIFKSYVLLHVNSYTFIQLGTLRRLWGTGDSNMYIKIKLCNGNQRKNNLQFFSV